MWDDTSRHAELIFSSVEDPITQRLLYQAQMHSESFRHSSKLLGEAFEALQFHDFARSQSCHMTEGIFGHESHTGKMEAAKVRVWGFLSNTCSAGHKLLRCCANARQAEKRADWVCVRDELKVLPNVYRRARNVLEHLDEATHREEVGDLSDCSFSRYGILTLTDNDGRFEFEFTEPSLSRVGAVWKKVLEMLEARKQNGTSSS